MRVQGSAIKENREGEGTIAPDGTGNLNSPHFVHPPRVSLPETLVMRARSIKPAAWSLLDDDEDDDPPPASLPPPPPLPVPPPMVLVHMSFVRSESLLLTRLP